MTAVMQQPGMISNLEPLSGPQSSFTARKPAAAQLPEFTLPPPPLSGKYPSISTINVGSQPGGVNNLLTPPSNVPGDMMSPLSSSTNSTNNNNAANQGQPPYTPNGYWSSGGTGLTPFTFGTSAGTTPQPWGQNGGFNLFPPPRGLFSPSLGSVMRNSTNSPSTDNVPPPTYDLNQLPPFPTTTPMSAPQTIPALVAQQQHQQNLNYITSQPTTQSSPINPTDAYMRGAPPTPTSYYGSQPSSTPHNPHFPAFSAPSPMHHQQQQQQQQQQSTQQQQSPLTSTPTSRLSPPNSAHQPTFPRPFHQPFPPLSGPIMSNVHSPGGQMSLMGGFNSGHAAQMQQIYAQQQQQHQHQQHQGGMAGPGHHGGGAGGMVNERPFKCDQCPQSFNRNHDLKRHKRIHLAVKPFPCGFCDKSFSRKDALKRHILVKGCGKAAAADRKGTASPEGKHAGSSDEEESPTAEGQN